MQFFALFGMATMMAIVIPVVSLLISAAPDIVRYVRLSRM
jgi:hypothetical protein